MLQDKEVHFSSPCTCASSHIRLYLTHFDEIKVICYNQVSNTTFILSKLILLHVKLAAVQRSGVCHYR